MKSSVIGIFISVCILLAGQAFAVTIHVPGDYSTIQAGIDAAVDGDVVLVAPGTYVENIDFLGKGIAVESEEGAEVTVIDGNQNGSVVTFSNEEDLDTVIDGFSIENGNAENGGGIFCCSGYSGSSPTIVHCIIQRNNAINYGGGIYCYWNSSPLIKSCKILENAVTFSGGGIACFFNSSPTIIDCSISNNVADDIFQNYEMGGGIYAMSSSSLIEYCVISANSAKSGGGVAFVVSSPLIRNCIIGLNFSESHGGGLYISPSNVVTISNLIVFNNYSGANGGGIYVYSDNSYSPSIHNCIVASNYAESNGGGISISGTRTSSLIPNIQNCTIVFNNAEINGGGLNSHEIDTTIMNSIFWSNQAAEGIEIYHSAYWSPKTITISYSDLHGGKNGLFAISCG